MDILTIILAVLSVSFFTAYILAVKKFRALSGQVAQILMFYQMMKENESSKDDNDIHKENFIKFLSDSREWAFEYIETVQDGLLSFIKEIDPIVNYFDHYGIVSEGSPHYNSMITLSKHFKELKKLLPQDENA